MDGETGWMLIYIEKSVYNRINNQTPNPWSKIQGMVLKPTKVYQALRPEHFSRSYLETSMGGESHRWRGALCIYFLPARDAGFFCLLKI
jgi:hypothetical protein